ncbi:Uncharacterised protein [Raoultella planticola]|uniref:Uncharacterized protein n=1 Tax=Raoultella planticola TaxID=575 RepID=A0A485CRE1_RAOPL|nr:Uncharacterised protein [Raoultella planticola]
MHTAFQYFMVQRHRALLCRKYVPVVGNFVVVVPFRPIRNLKILDISALNESLKYQR